MRLLKKIFHSILYPKSSEGEKFLLEDDIDEKFPHFVASSKLTTYTFFGVVLSFFRVYKRLFLERKTTLMWVPVVEISTPSSTLKHTHTHALTHTHTHTLWAKAVEPRDDVVLLIILRSAFVCEGCLQPVLLQVQHIQTFFSNPLFLTEKSPPIFSTVDVTDTHTRKSDLNSRPKEQK